MYHSLNLVIGPYNKNNPINIPVIIIPNIVLNIINNDDITYVTQRYSTNETIKHVNEHDVKELVRNEIYDIEEKRRMMK